MAMTRRLFGSVLASSGAAMASAGRSTTEFVQHKVLRRPYSFGEVIQPRQRQLYDCLFLEFASCSAEVRVRAQFDGQDESAFEVTVAPHPSGSSVALLGLHGYRAQVPLKISISSRKTFKLTSVSAHFMHPGFRRMDGMIVYNDPSYTPIPEAELDKYGPQGMHHRLYPADDVRYSRRLPPADPNRWPVK